METFFHSAGLSPSHMKFRLVIFLIICGSFSVQLVGQAVGDSSEVPLVEETWALEESNFRDRLWLKGAADNALRSGLSAIAVGLYSELLESATEEDVFFHEVELNRISAYISLGDLQEARSALIQYRGERDSRWGLRQALIQYFQNRAEAAFESLEAVELEELVYDEIAWYYLVSGLLESSVVRDSEDEDSLLNQARNAAVSREQRAQIDLIVYRAILLASGDVSDNALMRLKTDADSEINRGSRSGIQFAKEYAIALYGRDRSGEAIDVIRETIPLIREADWDLRDELLLLQGLISGKNTAEGRRAFERLLTLGVTGENQERALLELVSAAESEAEIQQFLAFTEELKSEGNLGELKEKVLYGRAQLLYRLGDYEESEAECEALMQGNTDEELRESTLRLLALIAFQRQRYRTAAGVLIQLGDLVATEEERSRINLLVADCFFLAEDYQNAAKSYETAFEQRVEGRGHILFQWVLAELESGNLSVAAEHLELVREDPSIVAVEKWKALWNVLTTLQKSNRMGEAYALLSSWLTPESLDDLPPSLWARLLWFRCQLSLKVGDFESTPTLAGEVYAVLSEHSDQIDESLGKEIVSLTQVLEGQALIFNGREDEGLELFESIRSEFPDTRAAAQSYLAEARHLASQNLKVDAQQKLIELADTYRDSDLAPVALYEAALHALSRGTEATYNEANQILNRLADYYPEHPLVFYGRLNQSNLLRSFNRFGDAEEVLVDLLRSFPVHPDRTQVSMARAECILAQTGISQGRLDQAIGIFERLTELPDSPQDLRIEAAYKWAFAYQRRGNDDRVIQIYWLSINQFLSEEGAAVRMGATGRYWMSRTVISLGEALEQSGELESARTVYSFISDYSLPFNNLAEGKLNRLGQ